MAAEQCEIQHELCVQPCGDVFVPLLLLAGGHLLVYLRNPRREGVQWYRNSLGPGIGGRRPKLERVRRRLGQQQECQMFHLDVYEAVISIKLVSFRDVYRMRLTGLDE